MAKRSIRKRRHVRTPNLVMWGDSICGLPAGRFDIDVTASARRLAELMRQYREAAEPTR